MSRLFRSRVAEQEGNASALEANENSNMQVVQGSNSQLGGVERETPEESGAPEEESFGLFQLWPDPMVEEERKIQTDIDVIAIHGLGGHPTKTWESGERLWLRDFLPKDLRTGRILSFGYNSGTAFTSSKSRIRDFATQLLEKLVQLRRKTKVENRKTIFVCHSLGGIVLKQALIMANERGRYSAVGRNVAGVVFLGTPHRGSDVAFWGKTLGKFANFAVFGGIRTDLLNSLTPKCAELGDICSQFVERAVSLQIFTIYERLKMKGLPDLIVDETSAVLHLPNETPIPMEADHRGLVRYLTSSSQNYIIVRDCLTELFDSVMDEVSEPATGLEPQRLKFVKRLHLFCTKAVLAPTSHEWSRNSDWLLQHDEFKSWRDLHGRRKSLWLHGPPGSGKTVIAKQVIPFLQHESYQDDSSSLIRKTLGFFFDGKDPKRRTNDSLIASILLQLLLDSRTSSVVKYIDHDILELYYLDSNTMWDCFASIVYRSRGILFFLVIDALDEMERENSESRQYVLDQLTRIAANDLSGHLRILITDRHRRPYQFKKMTSSEEIDVDNQATHKSIEVFIADKVRSKLETSYLSKERAAHIEQELVKISQYNFLRAKLTWRQFDQNLRDWSTDAVNRELHALRILSPGLDVFYFEILNSIPAAVRSEARKAFSIMIVAMEPLSIHQLSYLATLPELDAKESTKVFYSPADFMEFFQKYCPHVVRIDENDIVSFTHRTIQELLSSKSDDSERGSTLSQFQMLTSDAHSFMLDQCLRVLELESCPDRQWPVELEELEELIGIAKERETVVSGRLNSIATTPCLRYAVYHWISHYQNAAKDPQLDNRVASFLKLKSTCYYNTFWELSREFDGIASRYMGDFAVTEPIRPLFHIMLRGDYPALVRVLIKQHDPSQLKAEKTKLSPLSWSILCERQQSFMVMLNSGLINVNTREKQGQRPIHEAVSCKNLFFVRSLVKNDMVAINASGDQGDTALHLSISRQNYKAAVLLLDLPTIDILCKDTHGRTPYDMCLLQSGAESVSTKFFRIQEERGYESITGRHLNLLRVAGSLGWSRMMEMVIESKPWLAAAIDESGLSPLTWHAYYGEKSQLHWVLRLIPDGGLPANTDFGKYNLVSLCAHQGWQDTTEMLMNEFGLEAPDSDHHGRNLLHWAIFYGWEIGKEDIVKYSPDQLNQQDRDGSTPLHLAIFLRNVDIIKMLVSGGASCVAKDHQGLTPAHLAADTGFRDALQIFIDSPYREFGKTRQGLSLLHYITSWFDSKTVDRFIVAKKPLLDCRDRKGRTPLHYAAISDNASAVESLLKHGANIDQWDQDGRTALHDALRSGGYDAALVLLEHKADATRLDNYSQSCLQLCARYGQERLGKLLLLHSTFRINAGDMFGMTALHRACAFGALSLTEVLLNNNADWTREDKFSDTPLDKAVTWGHTSVVKCFLKWLESNPVDEDRKYHVIDNALDRALSEEHTQIENVLTRAGARPTGRKIKPWRPYVPEGKKLRYWPLAVFNDFQRHPPNPFHEGVPA